MVNTNNNIKMLEMKEKITLILSQKVQSQISYLCNKISAVEWSGVLFYTVEGDITKPEDMKIIVQEILPLDKGTGSYTKYSFDFRTIDFMEKHEAMDKDWLIGHVHSHNSMSVFFSGTDDQELRDNAPNHRFYTSLIVNNKNEMVAKVATVSKAKEEEISDIGYTATDKDGNPYDIVVPGYKVPTELLCVYDCNIEREAYVTEDFETLVKDITSHVQTAFPSQKSSYGDSWEKEELFEDKFVGPGSHNYSTSNTRNDKHSIDRMRKDLDFNTPRATTQALKKFIPNLITYFEKEDFDEVEDALDVIIANNTDIDTLSEYLAENYKEILKDNFSDALTFPTFCLRTITEEFKKESNTYRHSKKAYFTILDQLYRDLNKKLKEVETRVRV